MNVWDRTIDISSVREIRAKTTAYLGVGAIAKIADIAAELRKRGIDRALVMCGRGSYRSTGAWDHVEKAFAASRITFALYDKVTPNPTVDSVDEAVALGRSFGAQAVVAIGGGSPIDAGKSAAILLEYTDKNARDLYELKFAPERAVPIVAVNLTHGTGTEVDRFAVVSIPEKEFKRPIRRVSSRSTP
jgi:alcohol dehydrogenase class IV